jgi:NDP-sugar pyrophosphorylase family protein
MSRERITITLKDEIIRQLDAQIDGERLRNRSHAIEYFLSKSLGMRAVKVLILAGGKPVDFISGQKALPKAMVKIAGKPLLEHTLHKLKTQKFTDVLISLGLGGENIQNYFADGDRVGINLSYITQSASIKGTAQALWQAREFLNGQPFLLLYGDVLSDMDFNELLEFHRSQPQAVCTMALTSTDAVHKWGLVRLQGSKIVGFEEKPVQPKTFSRLVNAGMYLMEPEIFQYLDKSSIKLEHDVFPRLAEEGKLIGYPFDGLWLDVSSSAAYKQALKELKNT